MPMSVAPECAFANIRAVTTEAFFKIPDTAQAPFRDDGASVPTLRTMLQLSQAKAPGLRPYSRDPG